MNRRYKFIAFEGIDGVGKTTLAKLLANTTSGHYYHTPPESIKPLIRKHAKDPLREQLKYFQMGNLIASQEIEELLRTGHVYLDRYFPTTQAYFGVKLGGNIVPAEGLLMPDAILYLTAGWPVIEERLVSKGNRLEHENLPFLKRVVERYDSIFATRTDVLKLDTGSYDPTELMHRLRKIFKI